MIANFDITHIIRNAVRLLLLVCIFFINVSLKAQTVKTGAHVLIEQYLGELEGRNVGLVMNPTSRVDGVHMLDTLRAEGVNITALFAPEHGFRGNYGAGEIISDGVDEATGLPVHSLYGRTRKPTPDMLQNIDLLIFDMQDVGARFYTYISTLGLVMEAASEKGVELWVLDRPNPAGGEYTAGWLLNMEYSSFVGMYPMPIAHGMTIGEVALMIKNENWVNLDNGLSLRIIKMQGWSRDMMWADTGLEWIPPSPNLPTPYHAWIYLGTCLIEGSNLSEGRGTDDPFLLLGSPNLRIKDILEYDWLGAYGVEITSEKFTPVTIPGRTLSPKFENQEVLGLRITDNYVPENPVAIGVEILRLLLKFDADAQINNFLRNLAGKQDIIELTKSLEFGKVSQSWKNDVIEFNKLKAPYLLY